MEVPDTHHRDTGAQHVSTQENKMKSFGTLVLLLFLFGCSHHNTTEDEIAKIDRKSATICQEQGGFPVFEQV